MFNLRPNFSGLALLHQPLAASIRLPKAPKAEGYQEIETRGGCVGLDSWNDSAMGKEGSGP